MFGVEFLPELTYEAQSKLKIYYLQRTTKTTKNRTEKLRKYTHAGIDFNFFLKPLSHEGELHFAKLTDIQRDTDDGL